MRGKRAKRLRGLANAIFEESGIEKQNNGKVKVGRTHGGPAFGRFKYPASVRWEKVGDLDVLVTSTDELRKQAAEAVESDVRQD